MPRLFNLLGAWVISAVLGGFFLNLTALEPLSPPLVRSDLELLELLQRTAFDYFWNEANPTNGLIRDRSRPDSKCSIAAVGFGLSALGIGVDRGYIDRKSAAVRVRHTLQTFMQGPQGPQAEGTIGYRGWYYHFLEMDTATRAWKCELSSIDTALLLAGVVDVSRFFNQPNATERAIRRDAETLLERVDWEFMRDGRDTLSMGWHPERGFLARHWVGYNEGMLLYLVGLGVHAKPLPATAWPAWTRGYLWRTNLAQAYVDFPPLFGHQYSHCWVDFRGKTDAWLGDRGIDYFENSRRATFAQHAYCVANPLGHVGYGPLGWGLTACDGPDGYAARGAPPVEGDDGTLAPTAVAASLPFAPEISLPTLRAMYDRHGARMWTRYGFRDALNPGRNWVAEDVLGIDQGPLMLMIENYRTGSVWRRVSGHPVIRRGLRRAGFHPLNGTRSIEVPVPRR